ncbi:MAG: hypothetical protein ACP5RF_02515 [Candidatus Micrarchaeia archaeon]
MKIYIIGDASDDIEDAVNILEKGNVTVIAKEVSDQAQLSSYIEDAVSKGDSNIIVLAKDPMHSSISLNKNRSINAALCSTSEDVASAYKDGANVIILKDASEKEEILNAILNAPISSVPKATQDAPQAQANEAAIRKRKMHQHIAAEGQAKENSKSVVSKDVGSEQEGNAQEEEAHIDLGNGKGFIGSIKNALGIIGTKKSQDNKAKRE